MADRFIGLDIGSSTVKGVELCSKNNLLRISKHISEKHFNDPLDTVKKMLSKLEFEKISGITVTGTMSNLLTLYRIPIKHAQAKGFKYLNTNVDNCVIISIGNKAHSILELYQSRIDSYRENSRCAQGTGNFLHQMLSRFNLSFEDADLIGLQTDKPSKLTGRCPVLLKTSVTHLHNSGESKSKIIAGLFDAVCENVQNNYKLNPKIKNALLIGGVSRSKCVRNNFQSFFNNIGINLISEVEDSYFIEAIGCALESARSGNVAMQWDDIITHSSDGIWEKTPPLSNYISDVIKLNRGKKIIEPNGIIPAIIGLDIGSTGSKLVLLDYDSEEIFYEDYVKTNGDPVSATKDLLINLTLFNKQKVRIVSFGVTGSGRQLIGKILVNLFSDDKVYITNEIIAHATGAIHYDNTVDTIFEIGGQDAKYIRLSNGIITDFALNEACSAGTGSFLEELCNKFPDYFTFQKLNDIALNAENGISLGQHCSVFISDVIEKAIASRCNKEDIAVGLFDSIILNYINRVKKNRTIGKKIFCQGMPFNMDALACAVAHHIGSKVIVPNNPGTVGALGVSLLTKNALHISLENSLEIDSFFKINRVIKDSFICRSDSGCLPPGNKCTIEKISLEHIEKKEEFYWGGGCDLWENGIKNRLPTLAPNPFWERELLIKKIKDKLDFNSQNKTVALTENFSLSELSPFFITFINNLGFNVITDTAASDLAIKRGKSESNVAFCAPAMMHFGHLGYLLDKNPDFLFIPVMVNSPNFGNDKKFTNCPIIQGSSYLFINSLEERTKCKLLNPIIKIGKGNLQSKEFINSCKIIANLFGVSNRKRKVAFENAIEVQNNYHSNCYELGDSALEYCRAKDIKSVVILGKLYSIYSTQLNSNIPNYFRELGILPIPMDCYRLNVSTPVFQNVYWGYSQNVLRAAYQISESQNIYSILCTNYSCGPDSFLENFYNYIMKGKASLIIENDGEAGNSGIKMRLEIFQHCIKEKQKYDSGSSHIDIDGIFKDSNIRLNEVFKSTNKLLLPYIGYSSSIVAACLRGSSINAEALPVPGKETLDFGRMYTSGKECYPMSVTLGSLLQYIHRSEFQKGNNKIFYFLPGSEGPCRFGNYNLLDKIIIENLGLQKRVIVLSPANQEFFNEMPSSLNALIYLSLILIDHLVACANYIRPVETLPGETKKLFEYYQSKLIQQLEDIDCYKISNKKIIWEIVSGNLFGFAKFLHCVAKDFSSICSKRKIQTVAIDGALYVRLDPFSNQNIVGNIERNCLRVKQVPFTEWLDFLNIVDQPTDHKWDFKSLLNKLLKSRIRLISNSILYKEAGIPKFLNLKRQIKEISPYIGFEAIGEAILSISGSIINHRKGKVDAILNIGPTECLQCKIAESILEKNFKKDSLITRSIEFNGDPIDQTLIEDFVYDVKNART